MEYLLEDINGVWGIKDYNRNVRISTFFLAWFIVLFCYVGVFFSLRSHLFGVSTHTVNGVCEINEAVHLYVRPFFSVCSNLHFHCTKQHRHEHHNDKETLPRMAQKKTNISSIEVRTP